MAEPYRDKSWLDPRIAVRVSSLGGSGSFATAPIAAGEVVIRWGGLVLRADELDKIALKPDSIIPIAEGLFMATPAEATDVSDYYLNHSCDPALWMVDAASFAARRDIAPGSELTADYAFWQDDDGFVPDWNCGCGAALCRGKVTGADWRLRALQERYRGHFSPFVNARIARLAASNDRGSQEAWRNASTS
jgi:SET domain-containing protein